MSSLPCYAALAESVEEFLFQTIKCKKLQKNLIVLNKKKVLKEEEKQLKTLLLISKPQANAFIESEKRISPIEIRTRLEKLPDQDLVLFGLHSHIRPEWMILTVLPIPPVTLRPSIH